MTRITVLIKKPSEWWKRKVISNTERSVIGIVGEKAEHVTNLVGDAVYIGQVADMQWTSDSPLKRNMMMFDKTFVGPVIMAGINEKGELTDLPERYL